MSSRVRRFWIVTAYAELGHLLDGRVNVLGGALREHGAVAALDFLVGRTRDAALACGWRAEHRVGRTELLLALVERQEAHVRVSVFRGRKL